MKQIQMNRVCSIAEQYKMYVLSLFVKGSRMILKEECEPVTIDLRKRFVIDISQFFIYMHISMRKIVTVEIQISIEADSITDAEEITYWLIAWFGEMLLEWQELVDHTIDCTEFENEED